MVKKTTESLIGKIGTINVKGIKFEVIVTNVEKEYGNTRFTVEPVSGSGSAKVEKVEFLK